MHETSSQNGVIEICRTLKDMRKSMINNFFLLELLWEDVLKTTIRVYIYIYIPN